MFINRIGEQFSNFNVLSVIDILFMAILLYSYLAFIKKQNSPFVLYFFFIGVVVIGLIMWLTNSTSNTVILLFIIMYCVFTLIIYSNELKRAFVRLSFGTNKRQDNKYKVTDEEIEKTIQEIIMAAQDCSKTNTGALIVIARNTVPATILESGTKIDAELTRELLETIFFPRTPLHDGAVVVYGNRIIAASCCLPLTQDLKYGREFGTRHRAGIGVSENCDVLAVMVSEETGVISTAYDGEITRFLDSEGLKEKLKMIYNLQPRETNRRGLLGIRYGKK